MSEITKIDFPHTYEVLTQFINDIRESYLNKLLQPDEKGYNRIASGNLINSVKTVINMDGQTIEASLSLDKVWDYVEHGSKPEGEYPRHWPPVDAIKNWIRIKPVLPYPDKNGKLPTTDQLAYLIGRKIHNKGIKGYHYLQQSIDEMMFYYEGLIEEALSQDITDMVDGMFSKYFK